MNGAGRNDFYHTDQQRRLHTVADFRFKVFLVWAICALLFAAFYPI